MPHDVKCDERLARGFKRENAPAKKKNYHVSRQCRMSSTNLENTANEDFPENNEELLRDIEYLIKAAGEEGTTAEDFVSVDRELITEGGHQTIDTLIDLAVESQPTLIEIWKQ
ncbi:hypothetical protein QE152_g35711 [Popillia japonica]|uniref:Uncharacterized protein n=1 Tax=Popillia japonica TaxID=7064 RepID=A0AAW1IFD1_POPJA